MKKSFLIILFVIIMSGCNANSTEDKNTNGGDKLINSELEEPEKNILPTEKSFLLVDELFDLTKDIERSLQLKDFVDFEIGVTTYEEVVDKLGKPTGSKGSGIVWEYYRLTDGSYVSMFFLATLTKMNVLDPSGYMFMSEEDYLDLKEQYLDLRDRYSDLEEKYLNLLEETQVE